MLQPTIEDVRLETDRVIGPSLIGRDRWTAAPGRGLVSIVHSPANHVRGSRHQGHCR